MHYKKEKGIEICFPWSNYWYLYKNSQICRCYKAKDAILGVTKIKIKNRKKIERGMLDSKLEFGKFSEFNIWLDF